MHELGVMGPLVRGRLRGAGTKGSGKVGPVVKCIVSQNSRAANRRDYFSTGFVPSARVHSWASRRSSHKRGMQTPDCIRVARLEGRGSHEAVINPAAGKGGLGYRDQQLGKGGVQEDSVERAARRAFLAILPGRAGALLVRISRPA